MTNRIDNNCDKYLSRLNNKIKKNVLSRSVIVSSFIFILSVLLFSVLLAGCTGNNYEDNTGFTTMNNGDEVSVIDENSVTMSNEANIPDAAETYEVNENSSAITVQWNSAWIDKEGTYHPNLEGEWHTLVDGDIPTIANIYIPPAVELVPRITFTNDRIKSPDLWVAKTVAVAMEGWEAPDTDFRFTLKLDGVLAKELTYQVFDDTGTEIFNMVDPSTGAPVKEGGIKAPWKTDRSGEFTLKANQRAKFEWVGSGVSYEVTEWETPNYTQLLPEGGVPAKGVVTDDGALAAFGNLYVPEDEAELTKLSITKNVAYPADLQCPDTPDFKFFVEVDGEPYALENYVLSGTGIDAQSDDNGGTTDENGSFTLKAGQTATFSNVPVGVDYKVYEDTDTLSESGWRAIGKSSLEGSTKAPLTLASFANATASFGVRKSMDDGTAPEDNFEFALTNGNMEEWAGIKYYIHNSDGSLISSEPNVTDEHGHFNLKAGQTAIFVGIDPDTAYNVFELSHEGYKIITPSSGSYTNKNTSDSVEVLPFVNSYDAEPGELLVTKQVSAKDGILPSTSPDFTFKIEPESGSVPDGGYSYSIDVADGIETYRTDENGLFTLKAGQTARFKDLSKGQYTVSEPAESIPEFYAVKGTDTQTKELGDQTVYFTFVNEFSAPRVDLQLQKADVITGITGLTGAEFTLERTSKNTYIVDDEDTDLEEDNKPQQVTETIYWAVDDKNVLHIADYDLSDLAIEDAKCGSFSSSEDWGNDRNKQPWGAYRDIITDISIDTPVAPQHISSWFQGFSKITEVDVSNIVTDYCTNAMYFFQGSNVSKVAGLEYWNTANITNLTYFISETWNMHEPLVGMANWDVSRLGEAWGMFRNCQAEIIDLSNWNPVSLKYAGGMFQDSGVKKIYAQTWPVPETDPELFPLGDHKLYLEGWDASRVKWSDGAKPISEGGYFTPSQTQGTRKIKMSEPTVTIDNLAAGEYLLTETKAPDGYALDSTPMKIIISRSSDGMWKVQVKDSILKQVDDKSSTEVSTFEFDFPNERLLNLPAAGLIGMKTVIELCKILCGFVIIFTFISFFVAYRKRGGLREQQ